MRELTPLSRELTPLSVKIKELCEKLEIPYLVHFTRWENIDGIFRDGLCPRMLLEDLPYEVTTNDKMRLDKHEDSVSLSIAFPNYKMFYRYRNNTQSDTQSLGWALLAFDASILWKYECAFCKHNAADSRISRTPIEELKSVAAFQSMFAEPEIRETNMLKSYDPTDPQAEVLIFDVIPSNKIIWVDFESDRLLNEFKQKYKEVRAVQNSHGFFNARCYVRKQCWKCDVECTCRGSS